MVGKMGEDEKIGRVWLGNLNQLVPVRPPVWLWSFRGSLNCLKRPIERGSAEAKSVLLSNSNLKKFSRLRAKFVERPKVSTETGQRDLPCGPSVFEMSNNIIRHVNLIGHRIDSLTLQLKKLASSWVFLIMTAQTALRGSDTDQSETGLRAGMLYTGRRDVKRSGLAPCPAPAA